MLATNVAGDQFWHVQVQVEGAQRLRLHLDNINPTANLELWIYNSKGETRGPFGRDLLGPDGDIWTPSIEGPNVTIAAKLSAIDHTRSLFTIREVAEIVSRHLVAPSHNASCLGDGKCTTSATLDIIDAYRFAVAQLEIVTNEGVGACSGGLLSDTDSSSFIPYFLTANHCLKTQQEASTLEATWDYFTNSCNGTIPNPSTLPRTNGATLLATGVASDFTLLRLNSIPSGRIFLGWNADPAAVAHNTAIHRLSHPYPDDLFPLPQMYSRSRVNSTPSTVCTGASTTNFIYSTPQQGTTFGGSSGSPVILPGGYVIGQLLGICPGVDEPCVAGSSISQMDGRFSQTYPAIAQWLNPGTSTGPCTPDVDTLCIDDQPGDRRFKVEISFSAQGGTLTGTGKAVPLSSLGIARGGLFWFFSADNPEFLIKVLNACGLNNRYWVFFSAGTNIGLSVVVTDTQTGQVWTRSNPEGQAVPSVQDPAALPCS
jgi:V8-like Glu-specific endopeptidase